MDILQGFVVAVSMYSVIPMPRIEWNERNMKYCICFFPVIGLFIGLLMNGWFRLAEWMGVGTILRAAVLTVIPAAVTGGIHLDGLMDTSDAIGSWRSIEEKLEIMKDSRAGAFAVISGLVYFLLSFGVFSEADRSDLILIGLVFIMSRILSGMGLLLLKKAKNTGLLRTFSDMAANRRSAVVLVFEGVVCFAVLLICNPLKGAAAAAVALLVFVWYRWIAYRNFGGITGDTAGFFLEICELAAFAAIVLIH